MKKLYQLISLVMIAVMLVACEKAAEAPQAGDGLLDPEKAFRVQVRQKDPQTLIVQFDVAQDYYLYKDKMRFTVKDAPHIVIQSVRFPASDIKQDPNFGRMEVFRNKVEIEVALQRVAGSTKMTLLTDYQGCQETLGICYMPLQKEVVLTLR